MAEIDPAVLVADNDEYSLEYLIEFQVLHDVHGSGKIVSVDDDRETCHLCFDDGVEFDLPAKGVGNLTDPWHIDAKRLGDVYVAYVSEMNAFADQRRVLEAELASAKEAIRLQIIRKKFMSEMAGESAANRTSDRKFDH